MVTLSRIFGSGRNGRNLGSGPSPVFPALDANAIASELRVDQRGAQRGVQSLPSSDDTGFDQVEQEIVNRVEVIRNEGLNSYDEWVRVYKQRIARMNAVGATIKKVVSQAQTDFQTEIVKCQGDLQNTQKNVQDAEISFNNFREENRINDAAHEESELLKWIAISLGIIVVESALNGNFLAEGHEMGLAGGITFALGISVVNVGLASLAGLLTRNFNHVRLWRKVIGTLSFLVATGLALVFNFVVAHFRDAMTATAWDQAAGRAVDRALAGNLPESIDAWLLALLGLLAAALAGWKTYGADHPYPGYGRNSRKRKKNREKEAALRQHAVEMLDYCRKNFDTDFDDLRDKIGDAVQAQSEWASLRKQRKSFLAQCDMVVNQLLTRYQNANRGQRDNMEPPRHFGEEYRFPEVSPTDAPPDLASHTGKLEVIINEALQKIHVAHENAIRVFQLSGKPVI